MAELNSLIPKTYPERLTQAKKSLGVLLFLGVVLLVLSLLAFGGTFFYKRLVVQQIQDLSESLERIETDFESSLVQELSRVSLAVDTSKQLLAGHRSFSRVFQFLEENTLTTVRFSRFTFSAQDYSLKMSGETLSYADLALQSKAIEGDPLINSVTFTDFAPTPTGGVSFSVDINFNPGIISFR